MLLSSLFCFLFRLLRFDRDPESRPAHERLRVKHTRDNSEIERERSDIELDSFTSGIRAWLRAKGIGESGNSKDSIGSEGTRRRTLQIDVRS